MFEVTTNIFLHHIDDIEEDIYHSSKNIHARTDNMPSNNQFLLGKSVDPNLEFNFNLAKLNQFSMSESTTNIFLNHIDVLEEDIYHSSKRIHARTGPPLGFLGHYLRGGFGKSIGSPFISI